MIEGYAPCRDCPLHDCPPVRGFGPKQSLTIIGEAPGANEVVKGKPFVGQSGELLRSVLSGLGVHPDSVYYTNACLCRPPGNETPNAVAIRCCHQRLVDELNEVQPTKVLTVGATALTSLLEAKSVAITKLRGLGMMVNDRYTVGTYHPSAVLRDTEVYRDFVSDMIKWLTHDRPLPSFPTQIIIPESADEARAGLQRLHDFDIVSCDIESEGFDFIEDKMFSIGFGGIGPDEIGLSVIIPIAIAELVRDEILYFLDGRFQGSTVFQNGKFDMQFLMHWTNNIGLWPAHFEDTMLMQYTLDERGNGSGGRQYKTLGLKDQARVRYDVPDYHFNFEKFLKLPESERPYRELFVYQSMDVITTARLRRDLYVEMMEESPALWDKVCKLLLFPGSRFVARMEYNGFPIDVEYFEQLDAKYAQGLAELERQMKEICDVLEVPTPTNWRSTVQVAKMRAALGLPSFTGWEREAILLEVKKKKYSDGARRVVELGLEYTQMSALRQNYVRGVLDRVGKDGRIRPDFALQGADTSRLSCRDPNLQNIPTLVGPIIRRGYIAPPGWILAEVDYSQLELRVAAFYSQDPEMMAAFREGRDIHRIVASKMFKKPEDEVTHLERYMAKYVDFGLIYGRSTPSLVSGWEMAYVVEQGGTPWTLEEADAFVKDFLNGMPRLRDWIKEQHKLVLVNHYTETPAGRRRRFPLITSRTIGHIERQSVNTPIQSLASDICLFNGNTLDASLNFDDAYLVSIVHDALYFLIREEKALDLVPQIIQTMETTTPIPFNVPLVVEAKVGTRWGELEGFTKWQQRQLSSSSTLSTGG